MKPSVDSKQFNKTLNEIIQRFAEENAGDLKSQKMLIVGIHTRGAILAKRMRDLLKKKYRYTVEGGSLDITLYRDDVGEIGNQPIVKETDIPLDIEGRSILLVDDVLYTGRTIRAALDALLERGRPNHIRLAVMVNREGRELPIQADYFGSQMKTKKNEEVWLKVKEIDGVDQIDVVKKDAA